MPRTDGKTRPLVPIDATLLIEYALIMVPTNPKYRCKGCDALFDTWGDKETGRFGAMICRDTPDLERVGPMCGACVNKIDAAWDEQHPPIRPTH